MALEISDEWVEAVEDAVGHGSGGWDMVDPKDIIRAVLMTHGKFLPRLTVEPKEAVQ